MACFVRRRSAAQQEKMPCKARTTDIESWWKLIQSDVMKCSRTAYKMEHAKSILIWYYKIVGSINILWKNNLYQENSSYCILKSITPYSLMDRTQACGACNAGSTPAREAWKAVHNKRWNNTKRKGDRAVSFWVVPAPTMSQHQKRCLGRLATCLLYTSPSPRD